MKIVRCRKVLLVFFLIIVSLIIFNQYGLKSPLEREMDRIGMKYGLESSGIALPEYHFDYGFSLRVDFDGLILWCGIAILSALVLMAYRRIKRV